MKDELQGAQRETRFTLLGDQLVEVQRHLMALHQRLAQTLDPQVEVELKAEQARRDALLAEWGMLALSWRMDGGVVALEPGANLGPPVETFDGLTIEERQVDDSVGSLNTSIVDSVVLNSVWPEGRPAPSFDIDHVSAIATRLGPPVNDMTEEDRISEAAALDAEINRIGLWANLPKPIQRALVGLVVARMRALQDESPSRVKALLERQLRKGFARLTQFSSDHQPGWVAGLSRAHRPESGTWYGDADFWWKALGRELGGFALDAERAALNPEVALNELSEILRDTPRDVNLIRRAATRALNAGVAPEDGRLTGMLLTYVDALEGDKGLKRLRRAVRKLQNNATQITVPAPDLSVDELPPDWPFLDRTQGRDAVIIGGDLRETRRTAIQEAFGFASVEWIDGGDTRTIQSLAERISNKTVDLVVLLARFINHKVTDIVLPACRATETDWVMVRKGYGLSQIRVAVERYLADSTKTLPVAPAEPVAGPLEV